MSGEENIFTEIRKRDGRIVPFEANKITQAIFAAARAVGGEDYALAEHITSEVINYLATRKLPGVIPSVEEIQDVVEKVLIERGHARTAKAYILYRDSRTRIREARSELMDVVKDILLDEHSEQNRFSPAEKMHRIAIAASQKYYLDNLLPQEIAEAHIKGSFYIHQLGYYSKTIDSLQLDLYPMLRWGFGKTEQQLIQSIHSILLQVILVLQRSRNDLSGELALSDFDALLGRILRERKNNEHNQELTHSIRDFLAFLGALSAQGSINPLHCSISFGLDTSDEGMAVARALLIALREKGTPKAGPRFIFMLKKGINMDATDPAHFLYQLALLASTEGVNLAFCLPEQVAEDDREQMPGYFSSGLRIGGNRHGPGGGTGRGNIATVTVNLPRLALLTRDEELFFVELDRLLRLAVRQLLHRFEVLTVLQCSDLPVVMGEHYYRGSENLALGDSVKEPLENGVMTLGFCGLREAINVLSKVQDDQKQDFSRLQRRTLEHMLRRVNSFAGEYDLNIALCGAVDAVETRHFIEKDRKDFGIVKGVTDREYYNNGFLLFQEDEGLEHKIEREGELHRYCPAGFSSKAVLLTGLKTDGMIDFIEKMSAAGINFFHLSADRGLFIS